MILRVLNYKLILRNICTKYICLLNFRSKLSRILLGHFKNSN